MITKTDWRTVSEELMKKDRDAVEPPTPEEMLAYLRGELSAEEEAGVRERLVRYPELVRTLTEPFPTAGADPGDPDCLSDEEFAGHWKSLQSRMRGTTRSDEGRVVQFWRACSAIAAALAVVLGLGWWQARSRAFEPQLLGEVASLLPDGRRGPTNPPETVEVLGDSVLLVVPLIGPSDYAEYRLELIRTDSNRRMWRSTAVRPREDGTFAVLVPKRFVRSGEYRIAVHGIGAGGERQIATYSLRVR